MLFFLYRQNSKNYIDINSDFCRYYDIQINEVIIMKYLSVTETAKKWNISERSVRNYCAQGRITEAFLTGKTWNIPEDVQKSNRVNKKVKLPFTLLDVLLIEKTSNVIKYLKYVNKTFCKNIMLSTGYNNVLVVDQLPIFYNLKAKIISNTKMADELDPIQVNRCILALSYFHQFFTSYLQ